MNANQPIGIFDSGVGGLTVAKAIKQYLPNEDIIYFGDTAHLPYGDKSSDSIKHYSLKISDFLLSQNCKVILIACNTASAHGYAAVKEAVDDKALVVNVIDPTIEYLVKEKNLNKIGVIGTKGTIQSNCYEQKIKESTNEKSVVSLATPLFAPMIEEGFIYDDISNAIIRAYLQNELLMNIDALILGCTHYPIIKNQIRKYYDFSVEVIDSAQVVAKKLQQSLLRNNLLNPVESSTHRFIVSDYTDTFETIAEMFFEHKIKLEKINFWD